MKYKISFSLLLSLCSLVSSAQETAESINLPAYEPNSVEVLESVVYAKHLRSFDLLRVNDVEYGLKDIALVLDTIEVNKYHLEVIKDMDVEKKVLVLTSL